MDALSNQYEITAAQRHSVLPLLLVIARRLRLLVGIPFLCAVLAVAYSLLVAPVYTATARILPPQYNENTVMAMQNQLGGESQLGNSALTLKNPKNWELFDRGTMVAKMDLLRAWAPP